jgi:hypothetical protein
LTSISNSSFCTLGYNLLPKRSKLAANSYKGKLGETTARDSFTSLHLDYTDTTKQFNFRNKELGSNRKNNVPDFTIGNLAIVEVKNWNCVKYKVTVAKVESEILPRYNDCTDKVKMLIISNPAWETGAKELLKGNNVTIIELGYPITADNMVQARNDLVKHLRRLLGYVHRTINYVYSSNNYNDISSLLSYNSSIEEASVASNSTVAQGKPHCNLYNQNSYLRFSECLVSVFKALGTTMESFQRLPETIVKNGVLFSLSKTKKRERMLSSAQIVVQVSA